MFVIYCGREEARNMWRSQEERWKSEHAIRKTGIEKLFATLKTQVSTVLMLTIISINFFIFFGGRDGIKV